MKRFLYFLTTVVVAMAAAACTQEPLEPAGGGDGAPVEVSFDVGVRNVLTKADNTPFDDASGDFELYVAAFDKADGALHESSQIGGEGFQPVGALSGGVANVHLRLQRSQEYRVVFFAQRKDAYTVSFADGNKASFACKSGLKANDASMDAFYTVVDVTAAKTSYDVTLKRPFAQLNVLVPVENVPKGQTTFRSAMTVKMPTSFDLLAGKAAGTLTEVAFAENAIAATPFGKYAQTHTWVGTAYVLVPESGKVEVKSFLETGMKAAVAPGEVPVKMNGRTNLVGNVYSMDIDLTVSVVINPLFDGPEKILTKEALGCYLPDHARSYVAGTDQYVCEYDGNALTFVLMNPDEGEQMVLTGFSDTMKAGDAVTITVDWKKGSTVLLSKSYEMSVVAIEDRKVWIADDEGNGFVIKK